VQPRPGADRHQLSFGQSDRDPVDAENPLRRISEALCPVPHRIKYLEMLYDYILGQKDVIMWTGAEILDWYRSQVPA
jgi:hypothetical protein